MTRRFPALIATAVLLLTACGGADVNPAPGGDDPALGAPDDPGVAPPGGVIQTLPPFPPGDGPEMRNDPDGQSAVLVVPHGATADPQPTAFERVLVTADGLNVTVFYFSGVEPCSVLDRVDVEETDTDITITVFVGSTAGPAESCIALAEYKAVELTLDAPRGERNIIDGAA